jgi:predicted lysophospholipase L1 biosynthesis ABC-type transport system permease subunit
MFSPAEYAGMAVMAVAVTGIAFVMMRLDRAIVSETYSQLAGDEESSSSAELSASEQSALQQSAYAAPRSATGPGQKHLTRKQRKGHR